MGLDTPGKSQNRIPSNSSFHTGAVSWGPLLGSSSVSPIWGRIHKLFSVLQDFPPSTSLINFFFFVFISTALPSNVGPLILALDSVPAG